MERRTDPGQRASKGPSARATRRRSSPEEKSWNPVGWEGLESWPENAGLSSRDGRGERVRTSAYAKGACPNACPPRAHGDPSLSLPVSMPSDHPLVAGILAAHL